MNRDLWRARSPWARRVLWGLGIVGMGVGLWYLGRALSWLSWLQIQALTR